jgi:hypothetical protein
MEVSVGAAAFTVSVVEPETAPDVACIVEEPGATPVARPAAETVVTDVFDELHVTELVITCVLESEYVPVAVNCCVAAIAIAGFAGVTAIDVSVAAVTVRIVEPVTFPDVA